MFFFFFPILHVECAEEGHDSHLQGTTNEALILTISGIVGNVVKPNQSEKESTCQ